MASAPTEEWLFAAMYCTSGCIPGAKLFLTEEDYDNMPEEIHEAQYGGWCSGGPWGCMMVETFEQAQIRLDKLLSAQSTADFQEISEDICFDASNFTATSADALENCQMWWLSATDGEQVFAACLKEDDDLCKLDDWFGVAACAPQEEDKYNVFRCEELCRADMEGGTSEVYTAAQIEESADIQEELMS